MLVGVVGLSIAATLVILILPRFLLGVRLPRQEGLAMFLCYFLCLGAGYILIQVALIQRFVLSCWVATDVCTDGDRLLHVGSERVWEATSSSAIAGEEHHGLLRVLTAIARIDRRTGFCCGTIGGRGGYVGATS